MIPIEEQREDIFVIFLLIDRRDLQIIEWEDRYRTPLLPYPYRTLSHQGAEEGSLSDLGICFGDILPAVREKYPNQKISIQIHTIRAPSIILSHARGG